jgi:plasmid stabilization system protein ParE
MTYTVRLREEADFDIADAARWYERQRVGLGHEFLDQILLTLDRMQENPLSCPIVLRDTRRALVSKFPLAVFYRIVDHDLVVVAVLHASRNPRSWKSRF